MSKWNVTIRPEYGNLVVDAVALEGFPEITHRQVIFKSIYPRTLDRSPVTTESLRKRISEWLDLQEVTDSNFEEMLKQTEGIYEVEEEEETTNSIATHKRKYPNKCPKCGKTEEVLKPLWAFQDFGTYSILQILWLCSKR